MSKQKIKKPISAITGRFVKPEYAKENPRTTVFLSLKTKTSKK